MIDGGTGGRGDNSCNGAKRDDTRAAVTIAAMTITCSPLRTRYKICRSPTNRRLFEMVGGHLSRLGLGLGRNVYRR